MIRPFVVRRKNWLFSHSLTATSANVALYRLIETVKANGFELYDYLLNVFTRLPAPKSGAEMQALLPWYQEQSLAVRFDEL